MRILFSAVFVVSVCLFPPAAVAFDPAVMESVVRLKPDWPARQRNADGAPRDDAVVASGAVTLAYAASTVEAGLAYEHRVEPMPPTLSAANSGLGVKVRPISVTLRLQETKAVRLDTGRGYVDVPFRRFGAALLDQPLPVFTGDKTVRALGWRTLGPTPLWSIRHDAPLPFTLLSAATRIAANG